MPPDRPPNVAQGPSPLARGSRGVEQRRAFRAGSIPARAGQPTPHLPKPDAAGVHPRSRGAAPASAPDGNLATGPSPLARGSLPIEHAHQVAKGSIPARAGQPTSSSGRRRRRWVHPRSRGAAGMVVYDVHRHKGPSPLARGSRCSRAWCGSVGGSIPARAGQPHRTTSFLRPIRVHPRSRGAASVQPWGR